MGMLLHNVELPWLPVLSHRHLLLSKRTTPQTPCSRWSQAVDPFWRAEKVSAEFYPSNSYPVNSCVWRRRFWCDPVGLWRRYRWKRGSSSVRMAYMIYIKVYSKYGCVAGWRSISRSKPSAQSKPTTPQTPCVRSVEPAAHLESRKDTRRVLPVVSLPGEFLCVTSSILV